MASISAGRSKPRDGLKAYRVRWRYRDESGQLVPDERTVFGMAAARDLKSEVEVEFEGSDRSVLSDKTLGEAVDEWLRLYASTPRSKAVGAMVQPTTWETAEAHLTALCEHVGEDQLLNEITADDVTLAIAERRRMDTGGPVAATTQDRMARVVRAFLADVRGQGWLVDDVAAGVPATWSDPTERSRELVPSIRDLRSVAEALDSGRYYRVADHDAWRPSDILWCFALSGMLWSEAAGVRAGDVDLEQRRIHLSRVRPKRTVEDRGYGKSGARVPREVPVDRRLAATVTRLLAYSATDRLLAGPDAQPIRYDWWRHALERACERASSAERPISYTTYDLRHVAASLWIRSGATKYFVMRAGGWSSMDMVERHYGHLWPGELGQLVDRMDLLDMDDLD